jgi:peptide/nickel transport system permease protein
MSIQAELAAMEAMPRRRSLAARFVAELRHNIPAVLGLFVIFVIVTCSIFAPFIATHDPNRLHFTKRFAPPGREFLLGTDHQGRDIFSRIVWGARTSVTIGLAGVIIGAVIGITMGTVAGYYGGKADAAVLWVVDLLLAFPGSLLAILIITMLGAGSHNVAIAIGVFSVPTYARLSRGQVLANKNREFVEAARAVGQTDTMIILRHVLLNSIAPLVVYSTMRIATAILTIASLSYIGLGIGPPLAEWGSMIAMGQAYGRNYPNLVVIPGLAVFLTVMAFNFVGDALQDALDPRMRR